jgi:hypothetical protein
MRKSGGGKVFEVEELPADHSCGFHGLGVARDDAAAALLKHRGDDEVLNFVAADLVAALQTGERKTFPQEIREDQELWGALASYYAAQQSLDESRREARELMAAENGGIAGSLEVVSSGPGRPGGDVGEAMQALCAELKARIGDSPSGPAKTVLMQRLGRCHTQVKSIQAACEAMHKAEEVLQSQCRARFDAYVAALCKAHSARYIVLEY